jgi:hypothetical protein
MNLEYIHEQIFIFKKTHIGIHPELIIISPNDFKSLMEECKNILEYYYDPEDGDYRLEGLKVHRSLDAKNGEIIVK